MQRLRSTWLALMGGGLLVTLSISSAFGAPPSQTEDGPRGQSVSAFVHALVFGEQAPEEEPEQEEEEFEEQQEEDEEDQQLEEQQVDDEEDEESDAHGQCVSAVAQDKDGENDREGADYANHGERVSEAARVLCGAEGDEQSDLEENSEDDLDEESLGTDEDEGGTAGPGNSGQAKATGKASAPGQQAVQPAGNGRGGPPAQAAGRGGGNGNGGGNGRGGR